MPSDPMRLDLGDEFEPPPPPGPPAEAEWWWLLCRAAIRRRAETAKPFSTDEIWADLAADGVPQPREPRLMGGVIREAATNGWIIRAGGLVNTVRPEAHHRPVTLWVGTSNVGILKARRRTGDQ